MAYYETQVSYASTLQYDMEKKGLAVIFNHYKFEMDQLEVREGTQVDVENLENSLGRLNFRIESYHDLTLKDIQQTLKEVSQNESKEKTSCLMIIVLTHGELGVLYAFDEKYKVEKLWEDLAPAKCPQLIGVPKLFFIEACRGNRVDYGELQFDSTEQHSSFTVPLMVDFLQMYSSYQGYTSLRTTAKGSLFIQSLCHIFNEYANEFDLMHLLTFVSERVISEYQVFVPRQMPQMISMLRKLVKFKVKEDNKKDPTLEEYSLTQKNRESWEENNGESVIIGCINSFKRNHLLSKSLRKMETRFKTVKRFYKKKSLAIGVDLGANACVAIFKDGKPEVCLNDALKFLTPTWVWLGNNNRLIGQAAKDISVKEIGNVIFGVNRLIGRDFDDWDIQQEIKELPFTVMKEDEQLKIKIASNKTYKTYLPQEIDGMILKEMKRYAEKFVGKPVKYAVITVPAQFTRGQRQATIESSRLAGLYVIKIINESIAAAFAYDVIQERRSRDTILIYNLGARTFEVSVVKIGGRSIRVLATRGGNYMGEYFVKNLFDHCIQTFESQIQKKIKFSNSKEAKIQKQRLRNSCEKLKIDLSTKNNTSIELDSFYDGIDLKLDISQQKFEELNSVIFNITTNVMEKCLKDAKLNSKAINEIVLVGGSTRIPKVFQVISKKFPDIPICTSLDPDTAVAQGAAVLAKMLMKTKDLSIEDDFFVDVLSHSLGVEISGRRMSFILPKNTPLPTERSKTYSVIVKNQESITIKVYEGERLNVDKNYLIGECKIKNTPKDNERQIIINIELAVDVNNNLTVKAFEYTRQQDGKNLLGTLHSKLIEDEIEDDVSLK